VAKGSIQFEYVEDHDVYIVHPRWTLETEADCKAWHQQYVDFFAKVARTVDIVLVLDDFKLGKGIGVVWGTYRADVLRRFTRYSVRVHSDAKVTAFVSTSGVLHGVATEEARDIDTAIRLIELKRSEGG
jgi:hypothetical protein